MKSLLLWFTNEEDWFSMKGTAFFVKKPSRLNNLLRPHRLEDEVNYEIVKTILLPQIDYENLATDLTVDREYIEQNAHLCGIQNGVRTST